MKKILISLLMVATLLVSSVVLFAGCGDPNVDISGNYETKTAAELTEIVKDMELKTEGNYALKGSMDMSSEAMKISVKMDMDFVIEYTADSIKFSGNVTGEGTEDGEQQSTKQSYYCDGQALYIDMDGQKTKTEAENNLGFVSIPEGGKEEIALMATMANSIEVATSGNTTKIKFNIDFSDTFKCDYYLILKDGNFDGMAMIANSEEEGSKISMDIRMAKSSKKVTAPSDLDSYTGA